MEPQTPIAETRPENNLKNPSITPENVPPASPMPESQLPKQPNNSLLVALSVLLAIMIGETAFLAYQNSQLQKQVSLLKAAATPVASTIPTATTDPTANWKTYTNSEHGFSFKYPSGATYQLTNFPGSKFGIVFKNLTSFAYSNLTIIIDSSWGSTTPNPDTIQNFTLSGVQAYRKELPIGQNPAETLVMVQHGSDFTTLQMVKEDKDTTIDSTFDQILSTFKFLDSGLPGNTLSMSGTLQDFMKANCKPGNPQYLDFQSLPVNVDTSVIKPFQGSNVSSVYCSSTEDNTKPITNGYLVIRLDNSNGINIYDDQSKELGHGGSPGLGVFGQNILNENGIQFGAWLQGGDGPQVLGSVSMNLRGIKKFTTKDGQSVYVNYTETAIPGSDIRLVNQLKSYSSIDPNSRLNEPTVNYDSTMTAKIINYFYGKTPSTSTPEGQALQNLTNILSAITAK